MVRLSMFSQNQLNCEFKAFKDEICAFKNEMRDVKDEITNFQGRDRLDHKVFGMPILKGQYPSRIGVCP